MNLKVKWKLTTIIILFVLLYKSQTLAAEKWNDKWAAECGLSSSINKYPWIVAIYSFENIICYGAIISPHHIVTGLYCVPFQNNNDKAKLSNRYTVVAGRHKREKYGAISSQQSKKIRGIFKYDTSKERHVVILAVDVPFEFTDDVRPACVDWASSYEDWYFKEGNEGTVVGWKHEEGKEVPCSSGIQYWQEHLCRENLPRNFPRKYIGNDKYCAKYVDVCGEGMNVSTLAIGGEEAQPNEYPWIVAIYFKADQVCGGTLISRLHVLSAAHCFVTQNGTPNNKDKYTIAAGRHYRSINITEKASQKRKIKDLKIHENYRASARNYRADIALITLDEKITVSLEVQPVCIDWDNNFENTDFTLGKAGIVAGWGYTREAGSPSDVLKKLTMPFQPENECVKQFSTGASRKFLASDTFCAGYINKKTNVCQGDSGGGIYFKSDGTRYFIRGIVIVTKRSYVGCDSNRFSLYTRVSKYLLWIKKITE